jgi:uncharacterized membrane protein
MRVQYLLETIANEGRKALDANFPTLQAYVEAEPPTEDPQAQELRHSGRAGVITATDLYGLVELCREHDCWLDLVVGVGEYVGTDTRLAIVHGHGPDQHQVAKFFLIRGERSFHQDPAFGFANSSIPPAAPCHQP